MPVDARFEMRYDEHVEIITFVAPAGQVRPDKAYSSG
jgi:hypothetical protein